MSDNRLDLLAHVADDEIDAALNERAAQKRVSFTDTTDESRRRAEGLQPVSTYVPEQLRRRTD
jgi:hypothetical protein